MKLSVGICLMTAATWICSPVSAQTLECDRKLSQLETDVAALGETLAGLGRQIAKLDRDFVTDERNTHKAKACPTSIESTLSKHKQSITSAQTDTPLAASRKDLICAQSFSERVQFDIKKAHEKGDGRMVQRLLEISKRIYKLEETTTRQASYAVFLQSKKGRLLQGVSALNQLCGALGDIYE